MANYLTLWICKLQMGLILICLMVAACSGNNNPNGPGGGENPPDTAQTGGQVPQLQTLEVINITKDSARAGGRVTNDGGLPLSERGVAWDTASAPDIEGNHKAATSFQGSGEFTIALSNLSPETKYYLRAYAQNDAGMGYGKEVSFTSRSDSSRDDSVKNKDMIYPDQLSKWNDQSGNRINAHSGAVLFKDGFYYWYGTLKVPGSDERYGKTDKGVEVYRSTDLIHWKDFGLTLSTKPKDSGSDIAFGCKIQRPKVVYNKKTEKYVLFFKLYLKGNGIKKSHVGVATADEPTGPFQYRNKFLVTKPSGSGDYTLFQRPNGDLYHIAVLRDGTRRLAMAKMRDDYRYPATDYTKLEGIRKSTEGIAIVKKDDTYHLIGSGSNGWDPTAPRYYTSQSLEGPWTKQANPLSGYNPISKQGPDKSFGGQSSWIINVQGSENEYILMMDVHEPRNPYTSRYIWLPFRIIYGQLHVEWQDSWNLDWFKN